MSHPIYIESKKPSAQRSRGYQVWVTASRPAKTKGTPPVWMHELAPEAKYVKLLKSRRIRWSEFEAYYRTRLNGPSARDHVRALARLSQDKALTLLCSCPEADICHLPLLVRSIQECRDRGDFKLSLGTLSKEDR